ncbi:MAG TPA: HAD-IC family P-type ATPase, partial [Terrimesophilobacter sp.]|nr:HAD-IC family P-type ATPase [Terrimesophilobacter sp.]
ARELRRGRFGIDVLAVIAILATVLVGEYVASLIIVLMVSGGDALEDYAAQRAQRDLGALLEREPQIAHRIDGSTQNVSDIPATDVRIGDTILVRSGEVVPVDGTLASPNGGFDESSLTGESMPVHRVSGDAVLSGSINGLRSVILVATATAANSQFQSIIALVRQAQENRAPVVRLADRYAIPFTGVSLAIGIAAWVTSGDPVRFAEVLVLATPCPLVLAAPVAFMGGMGRTAVFDKTGTLTHGRPTIARIVSRQPFDETSLLTFVASAERFSSHVLAVSIVEEAKRRGVSLLDVTDSSESAARGILATVAGRQVSLGTLAFVREHADAVAMEHTVGGELAIYVSIDGQYAGCIIAADPIRANAGETIAALRQRGVRQVVMLTGDAQQTAEHVAQLVGIAAFRSDCLPGDKVETVRRLAERPVLMVGDGVNDAPVLAAAEVGIAMGAKGATAASESAAAVILLDDLSRVVRAVDIGRDTVRIALQSIWLGILLSVILMVIAAFGFIPATAGAAIQELVDLAAILNALRAIGPRGTNDPGTGLRGADTGSYERFHTNE